MADEPDDAVAGGSPDNNGEEGGAAAQQEQQQEPHPYEEVGEGGDAHTGGDVRVDAATDTEVGGGVDRHIHGVGHAAAAGPSASSSAARLPAHRAAAAAGEGRRHIGAGDGTEIWPPYADPTYIMPDEVEVRAVDPSNGEFYYFNVRIEKCAARKLYLGGYRNKKTGLLYHHASSQTVTEHKLHLLQDSSHLMSRETQTVEVRTLSIQTYREFGTQMQRQDVHVDASTDVEIAPRTYFSAEQLAELKAVKCIEIQRAWRGHMARRRAQRIQGKIAEKSKKAFEDKVREVKAEKERLHADLERKLNPKTKLDFALLFNELDDWRRQEVAKIKASTSSGEERRVAMMELLASETKALQSIQQLKVAANKTNYENKTSTMLSLMTQPHRWRLSDGHVANVQTPEIQRAKELMDLVQQLSAPVSNVDARLQVLLKVKWCVQGVVTCTLTHSLTELLDREADLLNRGRPLASMEALRLRVRNLFLQFVEDPAYNPRARDFVRVSPPPPGTASGPLA